MKFKLPIFFFAALLFHVVAYGQINVNNTLTVKQLVEDYLLGEGVEVQNITINGQPEGTVNTQAGLFTGSSNVVEFDTAIVMVTANAKIITGSSGSTTYPIQNDPDLMAISGQNINDAIIIEFDFRAISDSIKFNYVFASKEYPSYTCSSFNDAFGFFVSGPGINGPYQNNAINIALIPDTDVPVAINTVNSGVSSVTGNEYNCEDANPDWVEHSQYFVNNSSQPSGEVQFPGMTVTFTAMAGGLHCGEWYHIKLAIGDAVDSLLDSGVFLEAGSFVAFGTVNLNVAPQIGGSASTNPLYDSVLVAGCSELYIELVRPTGAITDSIRVEFGGTAIQQDLDNPIVGADYILGENDTLFFFPEGVDTISFNIQTIWDGIPDEEEYIIITIHYQDGCGDWKEASETIHLVDPYFLDMDVNEYTLICPTDQVEVSAQGLNGVEPYTYDWGDFGFGEEMDLAWVDVYDQDSTYYKVSISDVCGFETYSDSVLVINNIPEPLSVSVDPFNQPDCANEYIELSATIQNGNPDEEGNYNIVWGDGKGKSYSINENVHVYDINQIVLLNEEPNNFTEVLPVFITVIDTCGTMVADTVFINFPFIEPLSVSFNLPQEHCPTEPLVVNSNVKNGFDEFSYLWTATHGGFGEGADPTSDFIHVVPKPGMNYFGLTVSDYCGRMGYDYLYQDENGDFLKSGFDSYEDSLKVISLDKIMNIITPNGDGKNDYFVLEGIHEFDDAKVEIYDRWGKTVYKTDNYRAGDPNKPKPDDVFDGKNLEDGTYYYVIKVADGQCVESGYLELLGGRN